MKKVYPISAALVMGFAAFVLSACVDNGYDLDQDIDFTIAVGGSEFAIPGGMTEEIKLSKLLEVEEGDLVQVNEKGDYFLHQEGDTTTNKVTVKGFNINPPDIQPTEKILDFKKLGILSRAVSENYRAEVPFDKKPATFKLEENDLPTEIKSVTYITVDLDVDINFSYTPGVVKKILMEEVKIHMPDYFVSDKLEEGNIFYIRNKTIGEGGTNKETVHIQAFDCTKLPDGEGIDGVLHKLLITGEINMEGTFLANKADFTGGIPSTGLNLKANYTLANIKVNKVKGVIKPDIDIDVKPVTLNDLPDFLSDDEVQLDVKNPMIFLSLDNQIPVEAGITGSLSSYKDNKRVAGPIPVSIPEVKANENQHFCLSPEGSKEAGVTDILVPELTSIIQKIPDEIRFDIDIAATDKETEIELDKEYSIQTNYNINVPFVFGPNLSIVYKDTIDGWQDDLEDFEIQTIQVTSKVLNKIPLDLVFTAEAITKANNGAHTPLEGVTIKVKASGNENDNIIKAGGEQGVETPIVIEIKETVSGSIKKLDGLTFRAVAKSGQSNQSNKLNENQTIQLKEIKLKVPGGLKVNLN